MNTDKPLGIGLIAFGIAGIFYTMQITVRTFNDDPGPRLFPIIAFAILILCGLGMIFLSKAPPATPDLAPDERRARLLRGLTMTLLFIGYSAGLWLVGYHIATPIAVYAFYHIFAGPDRRVYWRGAVYAAGVTAGVHLVFSTFLHTFLPPGILF